MMWAAVALLLAAFALASSVWAVVLGVAMFGLMVLAVRVREAVSARRRARYSRSAA